MLTARRSHDDFHILCSAAMMWTVGMATPMDAQRSGHESGLSQARNHGNEGVDMMSWTTVPSDDGS